MQAKMENATTNLSLSVAVIIFFNILVFALHKLDYPSSWYVFDLLILVPEKFSHFDSWPQVVMAVVATIGSTFLHISFVHLFFNMLVLLAFGSSLARTLSGKTFLFIYFASMPICAIIPLLGGQGALGASGSISSVLGALAGVAVFQPRRFNLYNPKVRASAIIYSSAFWLALNVIFALFPGWSSEMFAVFLHSAPPFKIGWEIHIAGFLSGLVFGVITLIFYRSKR